MFEYSRKGLPHALMHATEQVEQGGHHGATCTTVSEAGHRFNLKMPAKFARTYLSRNSSQVGMLWWTLDRQILAAVIALDKKLSVEPVVSEEVESSECGDNMYILRIPLHFAQGWSTLACPGGRTPVQWGRTFLSKTVLISRDELISLLRIKLNLEPTWFNTVKLATKLSWECFGSVHWCDTRRTIVGVSKSSPDRRDFVRLKGNENGTALAAQVTLLPCKPVIAKGL